jgi:CysZ protein
MFIGDPRRVPRPSRDGASVGQADLRPTRGYRPDARRSFAPGRGCGVESANVRFLGFFHGFVAPFRGGAYIARERLWRYLVVPVVLNLLLGAGTMAAAARFFHEELGQILNSAPVMGWIFLFVMTVLGGVVLFIVLQPLLAAVFSDRLSEIVEKRVRGSAPAVPLLASSGRALVHALLKLVFYGLALVVGLALTALTGLGSLVGVGLGALFLAYDGFDYPLARRGATFGAKWAYLLRHPGLTIGFGLGSTLLYLVPLAVLVAPSFTAVGATLAFLDDEAASAARAEKRAAAAAAKAAAQADTKTPNAPENQHNRIDISAT